MRVTIAPTCCLVARPLPDTAALTSLGVCRAMGSPRRAAHTMAMPLAWAVPMTVLTSERAKTRSTATASGRCSSIQASTPFSMLTSRSATGSVELVRMTLTSTRVSGRPTEPSTTPIPQRVSPGSMPSTRTGVPPSSGRRAIERVFASTHANGRWVRHRVSTRRFTAFAGSGGDGSLDHR